MKVKNGQWRIASRDIFRGFKCTHCTHLSMAVAAGQEDIINKVKPYEEDLSMKLPIIQGNIWERQIFDELIESIGDDFHELESFSMDDSLEAMHHGYPIIAQAYMTKTYDDIIWSGLVDLLVRDDYELYYEDNKIAARKTEGDSTKYQVFDIKHSKEDKEAYQLQIANYHEVLLELGYASDKRPGLVLKDFKIPTYDYALIKKKLDNARDPLFDMLRKHAPNEPFEESKMLWHCLKPSTCLDVYCDYPKLCKEEFMREDHLFQLPTAHHTHLPKLQSAGLGTVESLIGVDSFAEVPGLKPEYVEHYTRWAQIVHEEKTSGKPYYRQIARPTSVGLPELSPGDLFFDIEWFNPVGNVNDLNFMWGAVDSDGEFHAFLADDYEEEKKAFQDFIVFSMKKLEEDPNMHIYHYHNPEPIRMQKMRDRYDYLHTEIELLLPRMVDLKKVANKSIEPGSGSYSIKKLERYYEADNKLNRDGLVAGGGDALLQYHLYAEAKKAGNDTEAKDIMQMILDYNEDDCLSTKLLAEWLHSIS